MTLRERFRDWLMRGYPFPHPIVQPHSESPVKVMDEVKKNVIALFEKYVNPRVPELVAQKIDGCIAAQLRELLIKSHDEWTRELTTTLLRHLNSEKEKEVACTPQAKS